MDERASRREHLEARVEGGGGLKPARDGRDLTAVEVSRREAGQIDRDPAPRDRDLGLLPMRLNAARPRANPTRLELDLLTELEVPADERARGDRAESGDAEHPVDRQPWPAEVLPTRRLVQRPVEGLEQLGQASAGDGRDDDERRPGQARASDPTADVLLDEVEPVRLDEVGLRQGDDRPLHPEQLKYREVLLCLGHDALVGRDDEQCEVDAPDAREHVLDEPLVARHVDDAHLSSAGQLQPGEAEVDRHAPVLLLLEPVRVDPGERVDERGLPVVDVARGSDDVQGASQARGRYALDYAIPARV